MPIDITSKATWSLYPIRETTVVSAKTRPCREGSRRKRRNATEKVNETCAGAGSKVKSPRSWHMSSVQCNSKKRRDDQQHNYEYGCKIDTHRCVRCYSTTGPLFTRQQRWQAQDKAHGDRGWLTWKSGCMSARKIDTFFEKYYHIVYPQCRYDRDGRPLRSNEVIGPWTDAHARPAEFWIHPYYLLVSTDFNNFSSRPSTDITASKQLVVHKVSTMNISNNK